MMTQRLHIYGDRARRSFDLPPISAQGCSLVLERHFVPKTGEVQVNFRVSRGVWEIFPSEDVSVGHSSDESSPLGLRPGTVLSLYVGHGKEKLDVEVLEAPQAIPPMGLYLLGASPCTIGSSSKCSITYAGPFVAAEHAVIHRDSHEGWKLRCKQQAGCYIANRHVTGEVDLSYGDIIDVFGLRLVFLNGLIAIEEASTGASAVSTSLLRADKQTLSSLSDFEDDFAPVVRYEPSLRLTEQLDSTPVEVEGPPAPVQMPKRSLIDVLGPSVSMVIPMILGVLLMPALSVFSLLISGGSALVMAFWAARNFRQGKDDATGKETARVSRYHDYIAQKEKELSEGVDYNKKVLTELYPPASQLMGMDATSKALWGRDASQSDYLFVRLGTGTIDSPKVVQPPKQRFSMVDDELNDEPYRLQEQYASIEGVPVGIDLGEHSVIGIMGGANEEGSFSVLLALVAQLAANYNPSQLKLALLCDSTHREDRALFESARWLPHVWSDDGTYRYTANTPESVKEVTSELVKVLSGKDGRRLVVIATRPSLVVQSRLGKLFLEGSEAVSQANLVICSEDTKGLLGSCSLVLENDASFAGMFLSSDSSGSRSQISFDEASLADFRAFAYRLARIELPRDTEGSGMPDSLTFLDMYGVSEVSELGIADRWQRNQGQTSLSVPIGIGEKSELCSLDVHEKAHGPHGLIAGTTGSGKSEVIKTWVLSLAMNFSPEEVSFLLIDFKGGGLVNQFVNDSRVLPHVVGTITNLSGSKVQRALVSIRSENVRRQQLLAAAGVDSIYSYAEAYRAGRVSVPLPHLMIVVDEFAELKKQFPDFMDELISVAAIGRSLGVHLVLATQRPAGIVDDKIQANTRFRICLKVASAEDSRDMLGTSDAAHIRQMGRGYLRVGEDELVELFQSGWSGAPYVGSQKTRAAEPARLRAVTGRVLAVASRRSTGDEHEKLIAWVGQLVQSAERALRQQGANARKYLVDSATAHAVNQAMLSYLREDGCTLDDSSDTEERIANLIEVRLACGRDGSPEEVLQRAALEGRKLPVRVEHTQLDAIVDAIVHVAQERGVAPASQLWLPELPDRIAVEDLASRSTDDDAQTKAHDASLEVPVGLADDPEHQSQHLYAMDLASMGNYLVCGASHTGRSTLLQTFVYSLIERYTPQEVNVYCLDFSNGMLTCFRDAPQVGGVLTDRDTDSMAGFFHFVESLMAERRAQLKGGDFQQYRQGGHDDLPAMVIVMDEYGSFREKTAQKFDDNVARIAREGTGLGLYLVLSARGMGQGEVPSRLADSFKGRVCLEMTDRYGYATVLGLPRVTVVPEAGTAGRGVIARGQSALEFQGAIALDEASDYERATAIEHSCESMASAWKGPVATPIPFIPDDPTLDKFEGLASVRTLLQDDRHLPIGWDSGTALPVSLDMSGFFCYLVSGKPRAGRANFIALAMHMAHAKQGRLVVLGTGKGALRQQATDLGATYIGPDDDLKDFCGAIRGPIVERNKFKSQLRQDGLDDDELYPKVSSAFQSVFVFVEDLGTLCERLYGPDATPGSASFFEMIADKGWYHQIFVFCGVDLAAPSQWSGTALWEDVTRDANGIIFGGNVDSQHTLSVEYLSFKERNGTTPARLGFAASGDGRLPATVVVVPQMKRQAK